MKIKITLLLLTTSFFLHAQKTKSNAGNQHPMRKHILILANDSMEGRGTGTAAERKAGTYIKGVMKNYGIKAYDQFSNYEVAFDFTSRIYSTEKTRFKTLLNESETYYKQGKDYWPLDMSSSGIAFSGWYNAGYGIQAPDLNQRDYQSFSALDSGKVFLINIGNPDGINPHSHFAKYDLRYRVSEAVKHGASGVVFYRNDPKVDHPDSIFSNKAQGLGIPVVYTTNEQIQMLHLNKSTAIFIEVALKKETRTGYNILGGLDYGREYTIVIGAHYDHLGWGDQGGSLHAAHSRAIHNGADDNASGVAMLLELIKAIQKNKSLQQYNYMFVAFSGEELGLYGSSNLVKNFPINLSRVNCMINMDMVGRLDPAKKTLAIAGTGTSPRFSFLDSININDLKVTKTESGVGPSDHTSFYKENIPVLHFFTGMHTDYHKPTDDEAFINYEGAASVQSYIEAVLLKLNLNDKLFFTKTKDTESGNMPRYRVSLGIMPDYTYDGQGVRADGVTEGKPAFAAGVKKGDVIIKLGEFNVQDMQSYTKALSNYSKGDKSQVTVRRDGVELTMSVVF